MYVRTYLHSRTSHYRAQRLSVHKYIVDTMPDMFTARLLLILLSGAVLGICFLFTLPWYVPGIVFSLALYALVHERNVRTRVALGYFFGICVLGGAFFSIFWHALPLDWAVDAPLVVQFFFIGLAWFLATAVGALPMAVWGYAVPQLSYGDWRDYLTIPSLFVLSEWFAACLLEFGMSGSGSLAGPHFGNGFLGLTIADAVVPLQLSALGGVYLLSFTIVAIGVYFARAIERNQTRSVVVGVVALACVTIFSNYVQTLPIPQGTFRVSALSTNVPPLRGVPADESAAHSEAIHQLLTTTPKSDVILVPEATDFIKYARRHNISLSDLAQGAVLIDSGKIPVSEGYSFRRVTYLDTETGARSYSYKRFLVSTGEYMPNIFKPFEQVSTAVKQLSKSRRFLSGPASPLPSIKNVRSAALSCNEVFSPELYRDASLAGAEVFLNIASHSWYDHSFSVYLQTQRAGRIRAAESQKPLVVANNRAPAYAIDRYGRTIAETPFGSAELISVLVTPNTTQTPYSRFGSAVLLVPLSVVVGSLVQATLRRKAITEASAR